MKTRIVLAALLTLTGGASAAEAPPPSTLTLAEAIGRAVDHNPALRRVAAGVRGAHGRADEARSMLLPRLDASAGGVYTNHPVQAFGLGLLQDDLSPDDLSPEALTRPDARGDLTARLDLQANLVDVATWYAVAAARHGAEAADSERTAAEARLVAQVVGAYHGAQLAAARAQVAAEAVSWARADVERARAQMQGGAATEADVFGLSAALAALEEEALVSTGDAEVSGAELDRLLGGTGEFHLLTTPLDAPPPALGAQDDQARPVPNAHPEMAAAQAAVDAAEAVHTRTALSWLPTLGVQGSLEGHRASLGRDGGNAWFAGVFLRMNLFAGLGDAARSEIAAAALDQAVAARDETRADLALAQRRARLAVAQADGRVRVATEAVRFARESHRLVRARFENGMAQAADVLRSRSAQLDAETHRLSALYARHLAAAQRAAAEGALNRNWNNGRTQP